MSHPTGPIRDWYAQRSGVPVERIVGAREIASMLGVSRQRVGQLAREDRTFPRRFTQISGGRLWHSAGIEIWIAAHRPGAPHQAANPFGAEAAALLLAAEADAASRDQGFVSATNIWLAIARAERAGTILRVLETLGVDRDEFERAALWFVPRVDRPGPRLRMTPRVQDQLRRAALVAATDGRQVTATDVAIGIIDDVERNGGRLIDGVLYYLERRGLDIAELRRRLAAAARDPIVVGAFERRSLTKRRPARRHRRRPAGLDLAPNPLGHDPWEMSQGAAFAVRKDGRGLVIDGEQWFFRTDGDGYYIRTVDGHPVGYRYRVEPPPRRGRGNPRPVNGFFEVLPMPPPDIAYWPDHRFEHHD